MWFSLAEDIIAFRPYLASPINSRAFLTSIVPRSTIVTSFFIMNVETNPNAYEEEIRQRIQRNNAKLQELGIPILLKRLEELTFVAVSGLQ